MSEPMQEGYSISGGSGVSATTRVWTLQRNDGKFEARQGYALFGTTNMSAKEFLACDFNPFHDDFKDNYAAGIADSKDAAIEQLTKDLRSVGDSLWM